MRVILSFVLGAGLALAAPALRITGGAVDDQVFQRGPGNTVDIALSGTAADADSEPIEVRITRKFIPVEGWDWKVSGSVRQDQWSAELRGVPAGGPYRIEVRVHGTTVSDSVRNVLVGDLWVLAGQSNMQGVGDLVDVEPPHELVHNFDMADHWVVAEEPLHRLVDAVDRVHWSRNPQTKEPERFEGERLRKYIAERRKGAGLGLPFAVEMVKQMGVPIGLVSCAHGGTSMDQWNPALKDQGGDSLYGSMVRRVREVGGKVAGVLWYQGESDANLKAAPEFQAKFERFIAAVREDFGQPNLPFYYVQIGRHVADANMAEWNLVQEGQRNAEESAARSGMAPAVDLSLDDSIHVGTQDLKRLGRRLANLALGRTRRGPRPLSAVFGDGMVRVVFSDVNGRLTSKARIAGFSIHDASGASVPLIYKAQVDPVDGSAVLLFIGGKLPERATLRYGAGRDPYCNLNDEADMASPVFGPMAIQ
ncbi:MAG TPA: sialate O-acetylesterase [Bryobacteraceae bacterium]|nr:sialate O-acetylesterase [Bryobacteraceae bacterium]